MRSGRHISSQLPGSDPPGASFDSPYGLLVRSENTHPERAKVKRKVHTGSSRNGRYAISI